MTGRSQSRPVKGSQPRTQVLSVAFDTPTVREALDLILRFGTSRTGHYVCFANAQTLIEAQANPDVRAALDRASLVTADGTPVAWCLTLLRASSAECVDGPSMTPLVLHEASARGMPVGFYGGHQRTLEKLLLNVRRQYPKLIVGYAYSPPFSPHPQLETDAVIDSINSSGIGILFVGLGCPKQERWMSYNSERVNCVMLGVGAVFDFLAGDKHMAPKWLQKLGLTWLFRFVQEPRRLWRRNFVQLPRFAFQVLGYLLVNRSAALFSRR